MNENLSLYVWKDVLCDYTCGVVFALATSADNARQQIVGGVEDWQENAVRGAMAGEPKVYNDKMIFHLWGGG